MGLDISVGIYGWFDDEDQDDEDPDYDPTNGVRVELENVNALLEIAGLPLHHEPEDIAGTGREWYGRIGRWGAIHALRGFAAHIALTGEIPVEADDLSAPHFAGPYQADVMTDGITLIHPGRSKVGSWFDHLILHADSEGFYVPVDFPDVLCNVPVGMLGSSYRLLEECDLLARYLDIPPDLPMEDDPLSDAIGELKDATTTWQRFSWETWACQNLRQGARKSIAAGAALVFS